MSTRRRDQCQEVLGFPVLSVEFQPSGQGDTQGQHAPSEQVAGGGMCAQQAGGCLRTLPVALCNIPVLHLVRGAQVGASAPGPQGPDGRFTASQV